MPDRVEKVILTGTGTLSAIGTANADDMTGNEAANTLDGGQGVHGLIAAETQMLTANQAEPALLLTPPDAATEQDDGLLTASEVAKLDIDADWVILSACNTAAAGGTANAEALSGLASAFLYAGGRSLLVSHWYVNSDAAVRLITETVSILRQHPTLSRSEAMRRSMETHILGGGPPSHPSYWAPFVVVGHS
jgi:CHAT domain-containing protein